MMQLDASQEITAYENRLCDSNAAGPGGPPITQGQKED